MYLKISDEERKRGIQHVVENVPEETFLQISTESYQKTPTGLSCSISCSASLSGTSSGRGVLPGPTLPRVVNGGRSHSKQPEQYYNDAQQFRQVHVAKIPTIPYEGARRHQAPGIPLAYRSPLRCRLHFATAGRQQSLPLWASTITASIFLDVSTDRKSVV